jgi:hypothetical protein
VLKFGPQLRTFNDFDSQVFEGTYGSFRFDGRLSGEPYADFLLGLPGRSQRLDPFTSRTRTAYELGLFLTDTFKVSQKVTLDFGLRWDYFGATTFDDGLQYNWDPNTGNVIVPEAALSSVSPLYPSTINLVTGNVIPAPRKGNLRPRVGIAYRVTNEFVIRGGYGQYSESLGRFHRALSTGPFQITETYFNTVTNGVPSFAFPNPFPDLSTASVPSQSIDGYPFNTENGVVHQYNVSVEKQIGDLGFRLSYMGSRNKNMNYRLNINKPQLSLEPFDASRRPHPQFVNTRFWRNDGENNYNALQFHANRKMGDFQFDGHYTLSSNMSNFLNLENPDAPLAWNREAFNSRHRGVFSATWFIPVGRGKQALSNAPGAVDAILGGWQLGWITYLQSGQYFSPSFSGADPSNTNSFGGRPDRIADGNLDSGSREITRWFDASAFTAPPAGRFGNAGTNILEGPGWNLHHLNLIKKFSITERLQVVFQGLFQNLLNHPHYRFPNSNITQASQVAQVTRTRSSREKDAKREVFLRIRIEF